LGVISLSEQDRNIKELCELSKLLNDELLEFQKRMEQDFMCWMELFEVYQMYSKSLLHLIERIHLCNGEEKITGPGE